MADFGGKNDGQCEWSWLTRCADKSEVKVTFGQQGAWTYAYCSMHAHETETRSDWVKTVSL